MSIVNWYVSIFGVRGLGERVDDTPTPTTGDAWISH